MSKIWRIPVTWEEYGMVEIEADTLEEAVSKVQDDDGDIPLPKGNYVDDSFLIIKEDDSKSALNEVNMNFYSSYN